MVPLWGLTLAALSAVLNGTFTVPSKLGRVQRAKVDPFVFNMYLCLGIALSCFAIIPLIERVLWTPLGLISGAFLSISSGNAFAAVGLLGITVASGLWCGVAVVASFLFGELFDPEGGTRDTRVAIVALMLLLISIFGIALAGQLATVGPASGENGVSTSGVDWPRAKFAEALEPLLQAEERRWAANVRSSLGARWLASSYTTIPATVDEKLHGSDQAANGIKSSVALEGGRASESTEVDPEEAKPVYAAEGAGGGGGEKAVEQKEKALGSRSMQSIAGVICAVMTGFFGGLVIAPMQFAPEEARGLAFLPSFAVGVVISAPIVTSIPFLVRWELPSPKWKETLPYGILSGVIWSSSNFCAIAAVTQVGYCIAYPIMQCGLFVSGLWGILFFGELSQTRARVVYGLSGLVLVLGAVLLVHSM